MKVPRVDGSDFGARRGLHKLIVDEKTSGQVDLGAVWRSEIYSRCRHVEELGNEDMEYEVIRYQ